MTSGPFTRSSLGLLREAQGWMELGAFEKALQVLDRLEEMVRGSRDPVAGGAEVFRGRCLLELHRFAEAADVYEDMVAGGRNTEEALLNLAWCTKRLGRLSRSIQATERLLELDPASAIGHYNLACYLALAGQEARCVVELKRALVLEPSLLAEVPGEADFQSVRETRAFRQLMRWSREELEPGGSAEGIC